MRNNYPEIFAVIQLLEESFPNTFALYAPRRKPLKAGIHREVFTRLDGTLTEAEIGYALAHYVRSQGYLEHMFPGAWRYGLDGLPASIVTVEEAQYARERLTELLAKLAARKERKDATPAKAI
jgi:ProP effector